MPSAMLTSNQSFPNACGILPMTPPATIIRQRQKYGTGSNLVTQTRSSDSIQRVKRPQWRSQVHDRGNKPDAHQQPEEKHATNNVLTVCVIFGGEPANSANNQRAYYALTQYGKDNRVAIHAIHFPFTLPPD